MKIALIGANGRMGKEIISISSSHFSEEIKSVFPVNRETNKCDIPKDIDIVIDFSLPDSTQDYLDFCVSTNIPYLSGVTGLSNSNKKMLDKASKKIPIFWAPNMSLGIAVTNLLIDKVASILSDDFRAKIEETHHTKKIDKPSGTAVFLKETAQKHYQSEIPVDSVREGDVVGVHHITFENDFEKIELIHQAKMRAVFAHGAIKAAIWLMNQKPGKLYGMNDLVNISF